MSLAFAVFDERSRLRALLDHFASIDDPRDVRRIMHPLNEVLLLVVCDTMADCDDYDAISAWGGTHLPFPRRYLAYEHGVPGGRWLTLLMNRINPALFSSVFTAWVRQTWPERPGLVAIDGKTSRRSHDRGADQAPLHLVSAFATTSRLVHGQQAVADKSNEINAIPILIARLAENGGLKGALVSIDAIATNAVIATAIRQAGADYLLAVKANQPILRAEIETFFEDLPPDPANIDVDLDKGHGRIEQRAVTVAREVDWLSGDRRFPGELRLPGVATIIKVQSRAELKDRSRFETRYCVASQPLAPDRPPKRSAVNGASRTGSTRCSTSPSKRTNPACEKATAQRTWPSSRHFAINLVRSAKDKHSIKLRRKRAGWDPKYLADILNASGR